MLISNILLPLTLHLLYHVCNADSTSEAVKWLEAERSVLVHLATPDLYFWNQRDEIATSYPGAFIFNFTLTSDNLTLLLNDEPILPRAQIYTPTPLRAPQIPGTAHDFATQYGTNFSGSPVMSLDYYLETPDVTSGTSIYNTKYNPRLRLDILRANMPNRSGYSTPLSSNSQNQIWVFLEDLSVHPPKTPYSRIPLRIQEVKVSRRWRDTSSEGTTTYKTQQSLRTCYIWSWLCADISNYPYYEYVYRQNFDQNGKKGSMRHFLASTFGKLVNFMGFRQAVVFVAVCAGLVFSIPVRAVCSSVMSMIELYRQRIQEVDEWIADEEVDGVLTYDTYVEDIRDVEKKKVAGREREEKACVKDSLPSPPP